MLALAALALYVVALLAMVKHHGQLTIPLFAAGIAASALAAWLSRGREDGGLAHGDEPIDQRPPPGPDDLEGFDWTRFEREFRAYVERRRDPLPTG